MNNHTDDVMNNLITGLTILKACDVVDIWIEEDGSLLVEVTKSSHDISEILFDLDWDHEDGYWIFSV